MFLWNDIGWIDELKAFSVVEIIRCFPVISWFCVNPFFFGCCFRHENRRTLKEWMHNFEFEAIMIDTTICRIFVISSSELIRWFFQGVLCGFNYESLVLNVCRPPQFRTLPPPPTQTRNTSTWNHSTKNMADSTITLFRHVSLPASPPSVPKV